MTSSNTFVTSSLLFKPVLAWNIKPNSHSQFEISIQNTSFFQNLKFGNDVTNNDIINSKKICLYLYLKTNYDSKFGSFITFGLAVDSLTSDGTL